MLSGYLLNSINLRTREGIKSREGTKERGREGNVVKAKEIVFLENN